MDQSLFYGLIISAVLVFTFWLPGSVATLLRLLALWQQKEYRRDRMRAFLKSSEGQQQKGAARRVRLWFVLVIVVLFLLMWLIYAVAAESDSRLALPYYLLLLFLVSFALVCWWMYEDALIYKAVGTHAFKRPQLTGKMSFLLLLSLPAFLYAFGPLVLIFPGDLLFHSWPGLTVFRNLVTFLYVPLLYMYAVFGFHVGYVFFLTILDLLLPLGLACGVALLAPLTWLGKHSIVTQARQKMRCYPDLRVIAVTGSFGKSSTKELIASILGSRYRVLKTEENHNTLIGVARTIIKRLKGYEDYFVVEMGAYTRGEIKELCTLTPPCISVVTAVNEQHLALFGKDLEATARAKFEIIEGLTQTQGPGTRPGIAVLNADNEYTARMATWIKERGQAASTRVYLYSAKGRINAGGCRTALLAMNVRQDVDGVHFLLVDNQQEQQAKTGALATAGIEVRLADVRKEMIGNYLAAVCVALSTGMTLTEIVEATRSLPLPLPGTYTLRSGIHGSMVIDESYSSNPDGFLAALDYLRSVKAKRRIVITRGMIELGSMSDEAHRRVGLKIAQSADLLYLTSHDSEQELRQGIGRADRSGFRTTALTEPLVMVQMLETQIKEGDVVLIEGRIPQLVHSLLCREK